MTTRAPQPLPSRLPVRRARVRRCSRPAPGCAYISPPAPEALPNKPIVPKVDGDLVYFNWADYVDPKRAQGLRAGVRREGHPVELRLDGEHAGQARRREPLRHHLPVGAVGAEAQRRQPAVPDRPLLAGERGGGSSTTTTTSPTPGTTRTRPTRCRSRCTRPGSPGARTSSATSSPAAGTTSGTRPSKGRTFVLDDRDEVLGMAALLLGYPLNTADEDELDDIVDTMDSLRPYLRGFSSDDFGNLLSGRRLVAPDLERRHGRPAVAGRRPVGLRLRLPERGLAGEHRHLRHSGERRAPRDRAAVHRLHAAPGERGEEHQLHRLPDAGPRHRGRLRGPGRGRTPSAR